MLLQRYEAPPLSEQQLMVLKVNEDHYLLQTNPKFPYRQTKKYPADHTHTTLDDTKLKLKKDN